MYSLGTEFRAVIRSDVFRRAMGREEIREARQRVTGVELSLHRYSQALPTEFVDEGQDLDGTAVVSAVYGRIGLQQEERTARDNVLSIDLEAIRKVPV